MKRLPKPQEVAMNLLHSIYLKFCDFPIVFREKVSEECDYSLPTFYRKMKQIDSLSNAEKDKIISVTEECIQALMKYAEMFKKK